MSTSSITPGRTLLTLIAILTAVGGYVADWNHTHVYNPRWPPHAKFHNGQTMSTGLLLGATGLYYLYRPGAFSSRAAARNSLHLVVWLLSLNWVAQLSGVLYPGSLPTDPEFGDGFVQLPLCLGVWSIIAVGHSLERRRLVKQGLWGGDKTD